MDVSELIERMREAVQAEKQAVQKALGNLSGVGQLRVTEGRRLHAEPGAQVYRLRCDVDFVIPEGMAVQILAAGQVGAGETLRHDVSADLLECSFREDFGPEIEHAKLQFDSTFLLNLLEERLVTIASGPDVATMTAAEPYYHQRGLAFLTGEVAPREPATATLAGLAESQQRALRFVLGQEIAYVWGPPGTGKTQTVASLVHALIDRRERVLLTAHTNIATDNALLRVLQTRKLPRDSVIRVGYHAESLTEYGVGLDATVDRELKRSRPELVEEIASLCRAVTDLQPRQAAALSSKRAPVSRLLAIATSIVEAAGAAADPEIAGRIASVARQIDQVERLVLSRAQLVATTLTRCYSSRLFKDFRTDAVLVDEASTASLALSFVVACAARQRVIAVGDFKQLPTIVQATHPAALKWLGRHVFETSGADEVRTDHPLRVMLDEQWRMHPGISRIVSRVFYGGRLRDAPAVVERAHNGASVAIVDTGRLGPKSESTSSGSKMNARHAARIAELVDSPALAGQSVAVITPYRAQVRAIREAVRSRCPALLSTDRVEIFTVHRFQGRDKDVVIFDLVEAPDTRCTFLDEVKNVHAPNLINVAMSRAREKLVIIGALAHLKSALSSHALVNTVLAVARTAGALELEAGHAGDEEKLQAFLASRKDR